MNEPSADAIEVAAQAFADLDEVADRYVIRAALVATYPLIAADALREAAKAAWYDEPVPLTRSRRDRKNWGDWLMDRANDLAPASHEEPT